MFLEKEIFKLACRSKQKPGMWLQKFKEETSASGNEKMISESTTLKFEMIYKTKTNIYTFYTYITKLYITCFGTKSGAMNMNMMDGGL